MPYDPSRSNSRRPHTESRIDPGLRDLLGFLRDVMREAAERIDDYLGDGHGRSEPGGGDDDYDLGARRSPRRSPATGGGGHDAGTRVPLERLRDEARQISADAGQMDPAELRLRIEAVTAETRSLQNRASDPEDRDISAKILRALTAIVAEHRPGHVYGLARHHQADWDEVGRRARQELASPNRGPAPPLEDDDE